MTKAVYIIFALLALCCKTPAQPGNSLVIYSQSPRLFTLFVNDVKINDTPQQNVKAFDVGTGNIKLKVEFAGGSDKSALVDSINIKAFAQREDAEYSYMISDEIRGGQPRHRLVFMSESRPSGPSQPPVPEAPKEKIAMIDNNVYGNLYKAVNGKPVFYENYDQLAHSCKTPLSDKEINYALMLLDKTNDVEDKFSYVEIIVQQNCYTTTQIAMLLNTLNIELDKLKLAKKAYSHLIDIRNAASLGSVFKYTAMRDEYMQALKQVSLEQEQKNMNCTVAISDAQFQALLAAFKKTGNEYDRTAAVKKALITNCLSSEQVKGTLALFSHDREKMEVARSAYHVVTDKENYAKLKDSFQFSDSKTEFLDMIK